MLAIQKNPESIAAYTGLAQVLADRPQIVSQILNDRPQALLDPSLLRSFNERLTDPAFTPVLAEMKKLIDGLSKDPSPAVSVLDLMVARNERSYEAYLTRGQFIRSHVNDPLIRTGVLRSRAPESADQFKAVISKAFDDAKRGLDLAPNDWRVLLFAAQVALAQDLTKQAREWAQRASDLAPGNPESYLILASVAMREKRPRETVEVLARGVRATQDDPVLLWTLADLRIEAKEFAEATKLVERLEKKAEWARPIAQYLSARMMIAEAKWAEACRLLEVAGPDLKTWPQIYQASQFWRAQCYTRLGRDDLAVGAYRAALEIDPRWAAGRLALAESLRAQGRIDEAIVELRQVRNLPNPPPEAAISFLRLAVLQNLSKPSNERDWDPIERELSAIIKQHSTAEAFLLAAEVDVAKGRIDDALRLLNSATDTHSKEAGLWSARVSLASRRKDWNESERLLSAMREQVGDEVSFRLTKAEYLVRRFGAARKNDLRTLADAPQTYSAADRLALAAGLARAAVSIQDYEHAERLWQTAADSDPTNLQIALQLFDLALQTGKLEAMKTALDKVDAIESGPKSRQDQGTEKHTGPISLYGDALSLVIRAKQKKDNALFDQALAELAEARTRRPGWSRIAALIAEIKDSRGRTDQALESYLEAIRLGDRNPRVIGRTLTILFDQKDYPRAELVIRELQDEKSPFSMELTRFASEASVRNRDVERGLDLARKAAAESKNVNDRVWLATVLQLSDKASEAESELRNARDAAPKDVTAWIALIQFYATARKTELAQKTLDEFLEARAQIDPKPTQVALAYMYQLVGRMKEAEAAYNAALKAAPDDLQVLKQVIAFKFQLGRVSEAESRLREVLTSRAKSASAENLAWARRTLAFSLASRGTYPRYVEATKLIDKNLRELPASDVDLRAQALVYASFPTAISRSQALESFAKLEQRGGLTDEDRIVFARLLALKNWDKSSQIFREVVTHSKDPRHIAAYVDALLNRSLWADAEESIKRLEELSPNDFTTADLHARALVGQKRYGEAFDRLIAAANDSSGTGAALAKRRLASLRLEAIGEELTRQKLDDEARRFFAQAEAYIRGSSGGPGKPSVDHLRFLIRRRRSAEILDEFDRLCEGASQAGLDEACTACASLTIEDHKILERIEQSIARSAQERPTPALWASLAAIQDRMGKYDDEESSLRRALALDGTRIEALNNLAYILSIRKKDLTEARALANKAVSQAGPLPAILDTLALVDLVSGQSRAAQADSARAVSDDPSALHLFHRAEAQLLGGNREAARDSLQKAINLGLTPALMHPLEVGRFQELRAMLGPNRS
ncbi:MAG TPA: tetratricopeptide repeat protein [Planctomycetaceae bacterium]|nr:tetratricopeptide repeat protein [Planctomycetaceae bacterium]